jgi:hypothetical protein
MPLHKRYYNFKIKQTWKRKNRQVNKIATQKLSTFNLKTRFTEHNKIYTIQGSSDGDYEDCCLEKCDAMWSGR